MNEMDRRWISRYEQLRTDPYSTAKGRLSSSRFQLEGLSWTEIRELSVGEGFTFGTCFEALRKSFYAYKMNRKQGLSAPDLCLRILKLQKLLGLPLSEFPELDRYGEGWVNEELGSLRMREGDEVVLR
jgi:hypothetical protein